MNQKDLAGLSGVVERTVRSAEQNPGTVSESTIKSLLGSMAEVAPFTDMEVSTIAESLGWTPQVVWSIERVAKLRRINADKAGQGREKLERALGLLEDDAEPLGEVMDTLYKLCAAHAKHKLRELLAEPTLPRIIQQLTGRVMIEMHRDYIRKKDEDQIIYTARLPSSIDLGGQDVMTEYYNEKGQRLSQTRDESARKTTRVVIQPRRRPDGSIDERFAYYTEEGVRLVPAPPQAKPLTDRQQG